MAGYVSLQDVTKTYQMGEITIKAADGISFDVEKGEFVIVVGPSGAGKTTVLNILGGMDTATSGKVLVDGAEISKYRGKKLIQYRREDIGFVFQFYNLMQNLTALENVELAMQICKHPLDASAVGASRMQLWQRLNKEGLLLLTLAALPAAVICYNIGHLELTEGYMEWGVVRFLITFVITYFLMSLMILVGIWFPARQVIRIHPAEALREE